MKDLGSERWGSTSAKWFLSCSVRDRPGGSWEVLGLRATGFHPVSGAIARVCWARGSQTPTAVLQPSPDTQTISARVALLPVTFLLKSIPCQHIYRKDWQRKTELGCWCAKTILMTVAWSFKSSIITDSVYIRFQFPHNHTYHRMAWILKDLKDHLVLILSA